MPIHGFHSEWITIKDHRIYLDCRASFPTDEIMFIAKVAVETCDYNTDNARVVNVFFNDKAGAYSLKIASTDERDKFLESLLTDIYENITHAIPINVKVQVVDKGNMVSDHYNHMEHLSVESGVAKSRWKSNDEEYQKDIEIPR